MAFERQSFYQQIKDTYLALGQDEFMDWWHGQTPAVVEQIRLAFADPAFMRETHQLMPQGNWRIWFLRMGRGAGKTFAAACGVNILARDFYPGGNGILVGATVKDVRDTMIEGDSGIIATAPSDFKPHYNKHDSTLTWPNGSRAIIRTADNPEDIRGPTLNWGWADELVKWRSEKSWDNLNRCVRNKHLLGTRLIVTTTPMRAKQWIRDIEDQPSCVVSTGSTMDNPHLDDTFLAGSLLDSTTTRGREEVMGEWVQGSSELWSHENLDAVRRTSNVSLLALAHSMQKLAITVDPGSGKNDDTGIILLGRKAGRVYVLADFTHTPTQNDPRHNIDQWTNEVVRLAQTYLRPHDIILLEVNNNAAAENVLKMKDKTLKIVPITQTRSKYQRAQECFAHFADDRVRLLGTFTKLEQELREWEIDRKDSPDRGDALTQGVNHLLGTNGRGYRSGILNLPGLNL